MLTYQILDGLSIVKHVLIKGIIIYDCLQSRLINNQHFIEALNYCDDKPKFIVDNAYDLAYF